MTSTTLAQALSMASPLALLPTSATTPAFPSSTGTSSSTMEAPSQ